MAIIKVLVSVMLVACSVKSVLSKDLLRRNGRENSIDLCDTTQFNSTHKVSCYCKNTIVGNTPFVFKADCLINKNNIPTDDDIWRAFSSINTLERLSISSKGDEIVTYVPTLALQSLRELIVFSILHGNIETVHAYAFANLTYIQEIKLSGNEIQTLAVNAFAYHPNLTSITLDNNKISEIKRNIFLELPQLKELFLTANNISIIHDRAFVNLGGLKTLELDKNLIFVLTNETFLGLESVTRLELGYNSLEVIGDKTFAALVNLRSLSLANNNIKMLDDKAFYGVTKLESLSLAHNKLEDLSNPRLFDGLTYLVVLDLKANGIKVLSAEVMAPILQNFYSVGSSLGFEDNQFPCDCKLNWFLILKNHTKNTHLQQTIENLMCYPSTELADDFKKYEENEKPKSEERNSGGNTDYDYYDESSMGGKLFFSDIPEFLVPCTETAKRHMTQSRNTAYTRSETEPHHKPEITTVRYTPNYSVDFNPTEEMVKDNVETVKTTIETTTRYVSKIIEIENGTTVSMSTPSVVSTENNKINDLLVKDTAEWNDNLASKEIVQTVSNDQTAPESMSHVHVSKASLSLHPTILSFVVSMCVFLISVKFKP